MGKLGLYKLATGCGITDYILCENMRDICDILFAFIGIVMIIALVFAKKRLLRDEA